MATTVADQNRPAVSTSRTGAATPRRSGYLHQLDFMRVITFLLVILVHTLTNTNNEVTGTVTNALALNLHFTRNAFFALTGLVLAYGTLDQTDFSARAFWRKRLPLVAIPFLVWAIAYWVFAMVTTHNTRNIPGSLANLAYNVVWGGMNGYQLYFIFVTLQIYLLFPAVLWIVRRTRGHHLRLLFVSAIVQLAVYATLIHWQPAGTIGNYWWHAYATFVPYQFFVFLGAVTAAHRERVEAVLLRHAPLVFAAAAIIAVGEQLIYQLRLRGGAPPMVASSAFQPTSLALYVALTAAVYTVGLIAARNMDRIPRLARVASYGAKRSFGVFLAHVMVLSVLLLPAENTSWFLRHVSSPWATLLAYVVTVLVTVGIVELLSRAPKAHWWVGRKRDGARIFGRKLRNDGKGSRQFSPEGPSGRVDTGNVPR
ncbi:acyltransferase [Tsukamurella sp. 8F]|uniref:acyltransferase n=1 Tax=unclassified Tsukamurella TaxID=2633480 RepID=UPI0023B993CC|nr:MULTISPECIES: acyltransferase [unclassified Tsukamurella]MDF0531242.1 acyltransferase [Tsukamurella sp. 8J]MDF0588511.1 acyltransferase [Tsukamurella sp. 8F]